MNFFQPCGHQYMVINSLETNPVLVIPFIIPFICDHFIFFLVPFSFRSTDFCLGLMLMLRKKISRHRAPNGNRISANRRSPTEWVKCVVSVGGILTAAPVGARTPSSCHARTPSGCHAGTSNKNRSIEEYFTYTSILWTPCSTAGQQQAYRTWNRTSSTSACRTRLPLILYRLSLKWFWMF